VTVFDSNLNYVDRKYIWTAITRARKLDNIQIFIHSDEEVQRFKQSRINQYFRFKCDNYKLQDAKANRINYKTDDYVNEKWFDTMLEKQQMKCYYCDTNFQIEIQENNVSSNITADRINSKIGHVKSNCLLSCIGCNVSKKDTYNTLI
jgi:hypothetical protein